MKDVPTTTRPCADCGASGRYGTCLDLFHQLMALDHEQRQPWASFHGLHVACYFLQHPSSGSARAAAGQWELARAYREGGLPAVHALERSRVAANRRNAFDPSGAPPAPDRRKRGAVTIEDLSVDGTFPAADYALRIDDWIRSVVVERDE
ncbi:MAG: DUF5946 family protein [Gordonia sp. (in: high G+C Gram-positive bacteria)]|uniref:DUF5946 family protein n=1 Tax=Gordonia sp. (in: high G+C Gram-positive bacteria) TaxID=84139 RepID=UPI0039E29E31